MWKWLWFTLSHPASIFGDWSSGEFAFAIFVIIVVMVITIAFMATAGRRIMTYSSILAVLGGCVFLPVMMNTLAFLLALNAPGVIDGGGILVWAMFVMSIATMPVTLVASLLYVTVRRRGPVR